VKKIKSSRTDTLRDGSVLYVSLDTILEDAGWYEGREIAIDPLAPVFEKREFNLFETTKNILTLFGDLYVCVHENIRLDLRFAIFDGNDTFHYANFNHRSRELVEYFFKDKISPVGLLAFLYEGKDVYSIDEVYVSKYGDIIVLSDLGIYRFVDFDDFLYKVYHKKVGRQIADIEEIEAAFPSESLSEVELSEWLIAGAADKNPG
jgi:hypothetical protein